MADVFLLKNKTFPRDPYFEILKDSMYNPTFVPLLNHTQVNESDTIALLTCDEFLSRTSVIIITSQRAVESLAATLAKLPEDCKRIVLEKAAYTVGPATFKILSELGFKNVKGGEKAGNGDILSDIILNDISPADKVVFFTGEIRRDIIPKKLINNGIDLEEVIIYKTEDREGIIEDFTQKFHGSTSDFRWIVFFSPQGTGEIVEHLKSIDLSKVKIGSIGPTTEKYLIANGIRVDLVSRKPDAQNLFDGMKNT